MDIFRVIYSLHGSLSQASLISQGSGYNSFSYCLSFSHQSLVVSAAIYKAQCQLSDSFFIIILQEQSVLQELQDKLHQTEQKVLQLQLSNRYYKDIVQQS